MSEVDLTRHQLPEAENERRFREKIVPRRLADLVPQPTPVAVFVGGQPGAGKTVTTDYVLTALAARGGAAHVSGDFYKPFHPTYRRLLADDPVTAGAYTRLDARLWHAKAEAYARQARADVVIETALTGPAGFAEPAATFRAAGYQVEVVILAVPAALSRLGILARFGRDVVQGEPGRYVHPSNHDACYDGIVATAEQIDADRLADVVHVLARGNSVLYRNELTAEGAWARSPATAVAILAERRRPWSPAEVQAFQAEVAEVAAIDLPVVRRDLRDLQELAVDLMPAPGPGQRQQPATSEQLASMSDLVTAALPPRVAEAVLADPQWPIAAAHLHRADDRLRRSGGGLTAVLGSIGPRVDLTGRYPARSLLQALHAETATSQGIRLAAQTHTADSRASRPGPRPRQQPTRSAGAEPGALSRCLTIGCRSRRVRCRESTRSTPAARAHTAGPDPRPGPDGSGRCSRRTGRGRRW